MTPCRPVVAECDDRRLVVTLADGRVLRAPLWRYPRLLAAPAQRRAVVELSPLGVHWPEIDEDISVASILRSAKAPGAREPRASDPSAGAGEAEGRSGR
jgi:Protein of unknown function (DUF2442)